MRNKIDHESGSILASDSKGPWDSPSSSQSDGSGKPKASADEGSRPEPVNPWEPAPSSSPQSGRSRGPSLEDLLRRTGGGKGGGFSGLPSRGDGKSWWPIIAAGFVALWLVWTSVHRIGPEQEGVVTLFGKYSRTGPAGYSAHTGLRRLKTFKRSTPSRSRRLPLVRPKRAAKILS